MLEKISIDEVKHIAYLAKAVRAKRDRMVEKVSEAQLGEPKAARGEHDAFVDLGFEPLPDDDPPWVALREAIAALTPSARAELRAVVWVGYGDYALKDWPTAVGDASAVTGEINLGALMEQSELHEYLMRGLYELKLA